MPASQRHHGLQRFALDEEKRFRRALRENGRTIVLWRGEHCPYSALFEPRFTSLEAPPGWSPAIRMVEHGGRGPVGEAHHIDVTPTVIAYLGERETARIEAVTAIGLLAGRFDPWFDALVGSGAASL